MITHLIVGLIKKTLYKMGQYFRKIFRSSRGNINVKIYSLNYATKADLKNLTHADISSFALKNKLS